MARRKRKAPSINSSSSADIAFMLLIFSLLLLQWIQTVVWQDVCHLQYPKNKRTRMLILKRNLLLVLINSNNQILCGDQYVDIKQLKDLVKEFVQNPFNDEHKPEKVEEDVPFFGKVMITKNHIISLQNDRGTEYQAYIDVQNELARAYNELRNEISKEKFGKLFEALTEEQQDAVIKIYPQKISEAEPKNYGDKK